VKCFFDPRQLDHAPERELHRGAWIPYCEKPARAEQIAAAIGTTLAPSDFGMAPIAAVHAAGYLALLREAWPAWKAAGREGDAISYTFPVVRRRPLALDTIDARLGAASFDASTPITSDTWNAAYASAQCALSALQAVSDAKDRLAFALCRPPGHHAGADYMGGYCYLNNAAIVARQAPDLGCRRVAILDVDYHHGNGTQDIFYAEPDTLFVSIHADPATDYPYYWGHSDERGEGAGLGANLNLPLPRGTDWDGYAAALSAAMAGIDAFRPDLLVLSFGADTFVGDPISGFALETQDFGRLARSIGALGLPTVVVMEGGYAVDDLGRNVAAFLDGF
jgi:acetoin utilization deacetylase AcuC-like enzyme